MTAMTLDRPTYRRPAPGRLTRRGRLVVLAVLAVLLFAAFAVGRVSSSAAGSGGRPVTRPSVVVRPGETLWDIARRVAPRADPRVTVTRIAELNGLGSRPVQAGQRVVVPG